MELGIHMPSPTDKHQAEAGGESKAGRESDAPEALLGIPDAQHVFSAYVSTGLDTERPSRRTLSRQFLPILAVALNQSLTLFFLPTTRPTTLGTEALRKPWTATTFQTPKRKPSGATGNATHFQGAPAATPI